MDIVFNLLVWVCVFFLIGVPAFWYVYDESKKDDLD